MSRWFPGADIELPGRRGAGLEYVDLAVFRGEGIIVSWWETDTAGRVAEVEVQAWKPEVCIRDG